MPRILTSILALIFTIPASALVWRPPIDNAPDLHVTGLEITVQLKQPVPAKILLDVTSMDKSVWRAELATNGQAKLAAKLAPGDFKNVKVGQPPNPMRFWYVTQFDLTLDGKKDEGIAGVESVKWIRDDKTVFPWEKDPEPVAKDGGKTVWPGVAGKNAGHFAWRYEPNGLLINNVSFNCIERSWYYFKPGRPDNESFQFNYKIPDAIAPKIKVVWKGDEEKKTGEMINRAGIAKQSEYEVDKGIYANDKIDADWTSVRWRRNLKTKSGQEYYQELRYGALAVGIQVETNSPSFLLSFQDAKKEKGPAAIALPNASGVSILLPNAALDPVKMKSNWLVLLAHDGTPEVPVMVVFQHRPDRFEWTSAGLIVHRKDGVGTLAIGTPFGAVVKSVDLMTEWSKKPQSVPVDHLARFANLLTAYPFTCKETFSVADGWVNIHDTVEFLPWSDDWNTKPQPYSPLPPLVSYSVRRGLIAKECIGDDVVDLKVPTKWGPHLAYKGTEVKYKLPIPDLWDYFPLAVKETPANKPFYSAVINSTPAKEIEARFGAAEKPENLGPGNFPHCAAHDFSAGGWRTANFMPDDVRARLRTLTSKQVLSALFPANYRYRRDPITGAQYVACTMWGAAEYDINGDQAADIDYWQGITLYGIYTHAKYAAMWDTMAKHWPTIRSLISHWEALHSWALMSPGARESGELYHGDMPTAGFTGLVGFYFLAERLGTPYQKDLSAYLMAKAAVPMIAKWGFREWGLQASHQELRGGGRCSGFGERFLGSFNSVSNDGRNFVPSDPWWRTGCIGPQSAQPEVLDLFVKGCEKDIDDWEKNFTEVCPNKGFQTHDDVRVMPHVMLRTFLDGDQRKSAEDLLTGYRGGAFLLRDTHVVASLVSWDCPVRLIDWSPAYVSHAAWDDATGAIIRLDVPQGGAKIKLTVNDRLKSVKFLLDGKPADGTTLKTWKAWSLIVVTVPEGTHELRVK